MIGQADNGKRCFIGRAPAILAPLTNHPALDNAAAWSPDGRQITFDSNRVNNNNDIYVMNPDGSNVTRLTDDPAIEFSPDWQPLPVSSQQATEQISDDVEDLVNAGILNQGPGYALISKLGNAIKKLDQGKPSSAINQLQAFINQVQDFIDSGELTPEQGQPFIDVPKPLLTYSLANENLQSHGQHDGTASSGAKLPPYNLSRTKKVP